MNKRWVVVLLLLTACHQSQIQGRYVDLSEDCRDRAEDKQEEIGTKHKNSAARNAELVTLFSDCMAKKGWQVATPKREEAPAGGATTQQPEKREQPPAAAQQQQQTPAQTTAGPPASGSDAAPANVSPQPAAANPSPQAQSVYPAAPGQPAVSGGVAPPVYRRVPAEQFVP